MTKEDQILEILLENNKKLNALEEKFNALEEKISVLEEKFNSLVLRVSTLEEKVDNIHQSLILLENDFHDKSSILFDEYSGNKEHLEQNEKDIKDLKTVLAEHSVKLISLEVDSKKHTKQLKSLSSAK